MARLILDTGVVIAMARGQLPADTISTDDDLAVPAVVIAEYLAGGELDPSDTRRARQRRFLDELLTTVIVVDYTAGTAEHHARLLAACRRDGLPRGAHDLIIAATARSTDRVLLTADARAAFADLPGVEVRVVAS